MIRNPAVAGSFYNYDPETLMEQIRALVEPDAKRKDVLGVMSPHAGYIYSGKVAGAVYSRIKLKENFIILGPNHSGWGPEYSIMREGVWRMPFGEVQINERLAKEIFANSKLLEEDYTAHGREHSIEVQIPFIQYFKKEFRIVPIAMRHYAPNENYLRVCEEIGRAIALGVKKTKEEVVIVASSDMTHYENQKVAERNDKAALDAVLELNARKLLEKVRSLDVSMCGYGPAAVMITACRELGAKNAELVGYMTSGDVTGDYSQVVGYAGVVVF